MTIRQELVRFGRELVGRPEPTQEIERGYNREWQGFVDAYLRYQGGIYQPGFTTTIPGQKAEPVLDSFVGYVQGAYKSNGVVFAVSMARSYLFTDIAFKWRRYGQSGGGNDLFGNAELSLLERPWPGGTTQQLLTRAEQDVTAAGTFFVAHEGDRLRRLRPDWCEFILSAPPLEAVQSDVVGIKYTVGGPHSGGPVKLYLVDAPDGVNKDGYAAFWSPIPDPDAQYRGMSWLTPVLKDKMADQAATDHKLAFFENAATPNLAVALKDTVTPDQFSQFMRKMNEASAGVENAYKTLYVGGGADVTVIGADMAQLDFRNTQGAGETRICAAGRVPPIIVGLSEGLSAATYSNYAQARRAFGDSWARPQWKSFAGAMEPLLDVPTNAAGVRDAQLWYDVADVAFLREDLKDLAEVMSTTVGTINAAIAAGWTPESAQKAVLAEDLGLLVHSGLVSVQLQPPGGTADADTSAADATAELTAKVGNIASLAPPGAFDPESVVEAIDAGDLSKLAVVEVEDPALEDPEIDPDVLEEDLANEALRGRHSYVRDGDGQFARTPGSRFGGGAKTPREWEAEAKASGALDPSARKPDASPPEPAKKAAPAVKAVPARKPDPAPVSPARKAGGKFASPSALYSGPTKSAAPAAGARTVTEASAAIKSAVDEMVPRGGRLGLQRLRERLEAEGFDRDTVDDALIELALSPDWKLESEANQKSLTPERRAAAISLGNQDKHLIVHLKGS